MEFITLCKECNCKIWNIVLTFWHMYNQSWVSWNTWKNIIYTITGHCPAPHLKEKAHKQVYPQAEHAVKQLAKPPASSVRWSQSLTGQNKHKNRHQTGWSKITVDRGHKVIKRIYSIRSTTLEWSMVLRKEPKWPYIAQMISVLQKKFNIDFQDDGHLGFPIWTI